MEAQASSYIQERLHSALRIIRSIEQRRNTIYRVVQSIIETQRDFFDHGMMHLKPMTLKDIAEKVGVHESTVSRAVNGKYVQCPRGVFELKYFFQSGVSGSDGEGFPPKASRPRSPRWWARKTPISPSATSISPMC